MQTIEIDKEVFENMVKSMSFLHTMVKRMWSLIHSPTEDAHWLTPYATAKVLCITPRMLQTLKTNGKISFFQESGGNCLFRECDVEQFMETRKVNTV